jgi:hypothetical protein
VIVTAKARQSIDLSGIIMTRSARPSWDVMPTTVAPWAVKQSNSSPAASQKLSLSKRTGQ